MEPNLQALINDVQTKLQLDPWNETGELRSAKMLSFLDGIDNRDSVSAATDFRWRDCEPLLEQATALLDRALLDRSALQLAGEKYATFYADMKRTIELIKITDQERLSKRFETPYLVSKFQCEAQEESLALLDSQLKDDSNRLQGLTYFKARRDIQGLRSGWLEYLNLSDPGGPPATVFSQPLKNDHGPETYHGTRENMANDIAHDLRVDEDAVRQCELQADLEILQGQRSALAKGVESAKAQRDWDDANRQYLAARADVEKEMLAIRLAMAKVEWLLDFAAQIRSIAPRYQQTLIDAHDRLQNVALGMIRVYGRADAEDPIDPYPVKKVADEASVDKMVAWARRTGTWLAALIRRSQNYILPISVKAVAGAAWSNGKDHRKWSFNVPEGTFDHQCYIRLRGIAGWVVGGDENTLWNLDVQLPDSTTFIYERGVTKPLNNGLINCKVFGVTSRAKRLSPDVVGITTCYNACPIGDWAVRIADAFSPDASDTPDDIHLDLYVSVLPL